MRLRVCLFSGLLLAGCGSERPLPTAHLYPVQGRIYAVRFDRMVTSFGDRHNPFSMSRHVRQESIWIVIPDSTGQIGMTYADILNHKPEPWVSIPRKEGDYWSDSWIDIRKDRVILELRPVYQSYSGKYRLVREPPLKGPPVPGAEPPATPDPRTE